MANQNNKEYLQKMRHSCAHLLAAAVMELWPKAKRTIGPAIENGFYYDFDFGDIKISDADLPKIEKEMAKIVKNWKRFEREEISAAAAKRRFADNPYKLELIDEFVKEGQTLSVYKSGDFEDLCAGGHVNNPQKDIGAFKLLSIAGAYWRGTELNPMLIRIYGTCFPTAAELEKYLWQIEEAKKRDHKKIGRELDLFSFHEEAPGFVFWHPNGMRMRQPLIDYWQELHNKAGYEEVSGPILLSNQVWKKSGHWQNYKDKMYFVKNRDLALKPMNCPGMIIIYKNRPHSYRELPLRWKELGLVHRYEPSGTLNGLLRERAFRTDDAHIFCREEQVGEELKKVIQLAFEVYKPFHFEKIEVELSTRPEKSIGTDRMWNKAESTLKKVLSELKIDYRLTAGAGAFYGPKVDFHLADSLGRLWQCGTVQLDFAMPERFDLTYIDAQGKGKRPVMIHRAIFGSIHRFFGILIEHYGGTFPLWLSPVQVIVIPIADRHLAYAKQVRQTLLQHRIRVELNDHNETMQAKIRDATLQKVPYMVIIGDREMANGKWQMANGIVSVRTRGGKDLGQIKLSDFIKRLQKEIDQKI